MATDQLTAAMTALNSLSTGDLAELIAELDSRLGREGRQRRRGKASRSEAEMEAGAPLLVVEDAAAELDADELKTLAQAARLLHQALQPTEKRKKRKDESGELVAVAQGTVQTKRVRRKATDTRTGRQEWKSYGPYLYIRTYASGGGRHKNETRLNNIYLGYQDLAEVYEDLPRDAPERRALREEILEGHKNGTLDEVCRRWVHQRMELLLKYADPSRPDISLPPTPGYQFRIEILELSFPIWRRFRVPAGVSFRTLHDTVQIVMGWENYHLYRFDVGDGIAFTDNPQGPGERYSDELIDEYLKYPGAGFFYEYDFGDRWDHMLVLEEQLPPPVQAPECIVGACACPPEDCGGPQLYDEFVHSRKKRKGRVSSKWQHRMGNYWDADAFDRKQINRGLVEYWQSVLEEQEAEVESEAKKAE